MLTIGVNANKAASIVSEGTKTMQKDLGSRDHKAMVWGLLLVCGLSMLVKLIGSVLCGESQAVDERMCLFGAFVLGMILSRLNGSLRDQATKWFMQMRASGKSGAESPHLATAKEEPVSETAEAASDTKSSPKSTITLELMQQMLDSASSIDARDLAQGIVACCESGNLALAEKWVGHLLNLKPSALKAVSMDHVHRISQAGIRAGGARKVAGWLGRVHAAGIPSYSKTLLLVMDALVAINEVAQAEQLLSQMEAADAQVDSACYELLFEQCIPLASTENVARATMWLQRIGRKGPAQLAQGFAAIIRARGSPVVGSERTKEEAIKAEINRAQLAEFWMNRALAAGVTQSTQCYNAVIEACARIDVAKAEIWLEQMENAAKGALEEQASGAGSENSGAHFGPDVYSYSMIMDAYAQQGDTDKAEAYFARMKAACAGADAVSCNSGCSSTLEL